MSSIRCTNTNCQTIISVPEGESRVICPSCNTYCFVDEENLIEKTLPDENDDEPPMLPEETNEPEEEVLYGYIPPPESENPTLPDSQGFESQGKELPPIGYLLSPDGRQFQLAEGKNILGRKGADLVIKDKTVSRKHCVIEVKPKSTTGDGWDYILYDIGHLEGPGSTNGVFLIGRRSLRLKNYERIPIGNESVIKLGNVMLTLICGS